MPSGFGKMSEDGAPEIVVRVYIPDLKANVSVSSKQGMSVRLELHHSPSLDEPRLTCLRL